MKLRSPTIDHMLKWIVRLIFLWLAIWGFLLYTRDEWMMWK